LKKNKKVLASLAVLVVRCITMSREEEILEELRIVVIPLLQEIKFQMATNAQALADLQTMVTNLVADVQQAVTDITALIEQISALHGLNPAAVEAVVSQGNAALANLSASIANANNVINPPAISVSISPTSAGPIAQGSTQQFSATVTGDPSNAGVTWSVNPMAGGTVDKNGLFTPPATTPGTAQVVATSVTDTTKSASASVSF
jgi:hypothetical protein